ncbi:MAG: GNAT family N-acetyltransferase [Erysipelotrichaceae bacterium]|nr:GNAT family N-acetyltransferase [Erysipelotrichaceae bacterium]
MEIKVADSQKDYFQLQRVRRDVFVLEQNVTPVIEQDETDDWCIHLVAYDNDLAIATCRIILTDDKAVIGRLAVRKEYRRQKVASALLRYTEQLPEVKEKGRITLHAQMSAYPLYEKCGYTPFGEHFYEAGIEHVEMEKYI